MVWVNNQCLSSRLVRFAAAFEGFFGRRARWNLCVSHEMQKDLRQRWSVNAFVLYDRAPAWIFRPLAAEEQHNFLARLMMTEPFVSRVETFVIGGRANRSTSADKDEETALETASECIDLRIE